MFSIQFNKQETQLCNLMPQQVSFKEGKRSKVFTRSLTS